MCEDRWAAEFISGSLKAAAAGSCTRRKEGEQRRCRQGCRGTGETAGNRDFLLYMDVCLAAGDAYGIMRNMLEERSVWRRLLGI